MVEKIKNWTSGVIAALGLTASIFQLMGIASVFVAASWILDRLSPSGPGEHEVTVFSVLFFGLGVLFSAIIITAYNLYRRRMNRDRRWLSMGYDVISCKCELTLNNTTKDHSMVVRLKVRATCSGMDLFANRYYWTGDRDGGITVTSPGHRLIGPPVAIPPWKYYYIHLGREMMLGEETEIVTSQTIHGDNFDKVLAKTVIEKTRNLALTVTLDGYSDPASVNFEMWRADLFPNSGLIKRMPGTYDRQSKSMHWVVPKPKLARRYAITWQ